MITTIKSDRIHTESAIIKGYISYENGIITSISEKAPENGEFIDYSDKWIIPGLFETHNHGVYGYLLRSGQEGDPYNIIRGFLQGTASFGITSILPTCTYDMIKHVRKMMDKDYRGSKIIGIHVEGPWLDRVGEKGVPVKWPDVNVETAKQMIEDGDGKLLLVAASPEIEGIEPVLKYFKKEGVKLAFAHCSLSYEKASEVIKKYYSVATHLGNSMLGFHHRDIGSLGACLLDDNMIYEVICDGVHISFDMLRVYFKLHDYSRFMVISDNSGFAGVPAGKGYSGWQPNQTYIIEEDGRIHTETGRISGSSKSILHGVKNLIDTLKVPALTAVNMASLKPAEFYGIDKTKGSLKAGKDADFVVIDKDFNVYETYSEGRKIYDSRENSDLLNHEFLDANEREIGN